MNNRQYLLHHNENDESIAQGRQKESQSSFLVGSSSMMGVPNRSSPLFLLLLFLGTATTITSGYVSNKNYNKNNKHIMAAFVSHSGSSSSRCSSRCRPLLYLYAPPGSGYAGVEDEESELPDTYIPMMEYPGTMRPGKTPENMPYHDLPIADSDPDPVPWPHFQEIEWHHRWAPPHPHPIPMEQFIEMHGRWATPEMEAQMRAGVRQNVRQRQEQEQEYKDSRGSEYIITDDDEDDDDADVDDLNKIMQMAEEPVALGDGMFGTLGSAVDEARTAEAVRPPPKPSQDDQILDIQVEDKRSKLDKKQASEDAGDDDDDDDDDLDNFLLDLGLDVDADDDDNVVDDDEAKPTQSSKNTLSILDGIDDDDDADGDDDDDEAITMNVGSNSKRSTTSTTTTSTSTTGGASTINVDADDDALSDLGLDDDDDADDDGVSTLPLDDLDALDEDIAMGTEDIFDGDGGFDFDDGGYGDGADGGWD